MQLHNKTVLTSDDVAPRSQRCTRGLQQFEPAMITAENIKCLTIDQLKQVFKHYSQVQRHIGESKEQMISWLHTFMQDNGPYQPTPSLAYLMNTVDLERAPSVTPMAMITQVAMPTVMAATVAPPTPNAAPDLATSTASHQPRVQHAQPRENLMPELQPP